jgi:hypothetical protein
MRTSLLAAATLAAVSRTPREAFLAEDAIKSVGMMGYFDPTGRRMSRRWIRRRRKIIGWEIKKYLI